MIVTNETIISKSHSFPKQNNERRSRVGSLLSMWSMIYQFRWTLPKPTKTFRVSEIRITRNQYSKFNQNNAQILWIINVQHREYIKKLKEGVGKNKRGQCGIIIRDDCETFMHRCFDSGWPFKVPSWLHKWIAGICGWISEVIKFNV